MEELSIEELLELASTLREYVAAGGALNLLSVPGAVSVIQREQIESRGATNITEAMRGLPGVDVSMITASQPLVGFRGANPFDSQRVALLVDGVPMNLDFFGVKTYTQLPVAFTDIERIDVLRSPGVLYGANAVAGAINVVTRRPAKTELVARLSGGENVYRSASASAGSPLKNGFFRVSTEYARTNQFGDRQAVSGLGPELVEAPASSKARSNLLVDSHFGASARANERFGRHAFDVTGALTQFQGFLRFPDRICEQQLSLQGLVASASHELTLGEQSSSRPSTLTSRLTFAQSRMDLVSARAIAQSGVLPGSTTPLVGASPHSLTRDDWILNSQLSVPFLQTWEGQLVAGVELEYTTTRSVRMLESDVGKVYGGVYALPSVSLGKHLRVFAGGRADVGLHGKALLSPTASAVYRLGEFQSVRVSVTSAQRSPNIYELGLALPFIEDASSGKRGYYFGNAGLEAERLSQAEVGYLWSSDRVNAGANLFMAQLENQLEMVEVSSGRADARGFRATALELHGGDSGLPYLEYTNQANVSTLGAEVFGEVKLPAGVTLNGSYTFLRSRAAVISDEADVVRRESAADRNAPPNRFSAGARYRLSGGPLSGATFSAFYDWSDKTTAYVSGKALTIPAWSSVTARISVPLPREAGDFALESFNSLDASHFEWPRHQVGRRILGTLTLRI